MLTYLKQHLTGPDQFLESLIYFYIDFCHIQDKALYNGRMFRRHFAVSFFHALIEKFLTKYGNIYSIFHSDKISAGRKY